MSKPSRSKRRELRQKGVRALERAAVAPPDRAAEERARAEAVLAAARPKPHVAVPDTPITSPITRAAAAGDAETSGEAGDSDGDESPAASSRSPTERKKAAQNRIPLVLGGLVALAFVIVFAASGGFSGKDDKGKPVTVISATPSATPASPLQASPTAAVTLAPTPSAEPPAPAVTASAEPSATLTATPTAAPTAAPAATPTAVPTATPTAAPAATSTAAAPTASPSAKPATTAAPAVKAPAPKPKPPVSSDPY